MDNNLVKLIFNNHKKLSEVEGIVDARGQIKNVFSKQTLVNKQIITKINFRSKEFFQIPNSKKLY